MSAREPLWYCHECHAEMRPLMVPDPHCASCNGTFVERIENPADDPRVFQLADAGHWDDGPLPAGMEAFFSGLQSILRGANPPPPPAATSSNSTARASSPDAQRSSNDGNRPSSSTDQSFTGRNGPFTIRIERSNTPSGRMRTFVLGGPPVVPVGAGGSGEVPRLSQFSPRNPDGTQQDRPNITGPMLAQYLLALMGPGRSGDPFTDLLGGMFGPAGMPPGAESGRWGDYVFNQEALDQIISQIMENSNAHQPVPATEEIIEKLPREVLEEGSPLLEKDCAVCKDQFQLETEDPDERIVITLPCHHPFHQNCILPWLKTSGTCPVCRYQLVPQPASHGPGPQPSGSGDSNNSAGSQNNNGGNDGNNSGSGGGGGLLQNLVQLFANHGQRGPSGNGGDGSTTHNAEQTSASSSSASGGGRNEPSNGNASRNRSSSQHETDDHLDVPGGWGDELD
ncbi:hypothetical protein PYCCODRAFT_1405126 [Trametes coccinea BRFM310]|uniref:RING-type domain-containing protein n=1 Tax=Trametes coccinea (strain BRFM310) TaxID=1353009 RepID=A0A1Y2IYQ6_TRAC3|nr:hypothetical protein PYCCODRAFT_1405126 [Trametes coccinea BRFM310]